MANLKRLDEAPAYALELTNTEAMYLRTLLWGHIAGPLTSENRVFKRIIDALEPVARGAEFSVRASGGTVLLLSGK